MTPQPYVLTTDNRGLKLLSLCCLSHKHAPLPNMELGVQLVSLQPEHLSGRQRATSAATGRLHLSSQWLITMPESILRTPLKWDQ